MESMEESVMTTGRKERILATLRELKPEIQAKFKVKEIGVFDSIIRGEERGESDIDVLVEFGDDASLFDLVGLARLARDVVHLPPQRGKVRMGVIVP